jgi:hypothetical protein
LLSKTAREILAICNYGNQDDDAKNSHAQKSLFYISEKPNLDTLATWRRATETDTPSNARVREPSIPVSCPCIGRGSCARYARLV